MQRASAPAGRWPRWSQALRSAGLLVAIGPSDPLTRTLSAAKAQLPIHHGAGSRAAQDPIGGPLHDQVIDNAVGQAMHLFRTKDEMALASASHDCQRRFRDNPGTQLLDRCAAFDDAVVGLQDRDPLRDEGPFAPLAVTGRQWSSASALSDDYLAIDSRLDQVRLRVEIALAPQVPPVAPATTNRNSD